MSEGIVVDRIGTAGRASRSGAGRPRQLITEARVRHSLRGSYEAYADVVVERREVAAPAASDSTQVDLGALRDIADRFEKVTLRLERYLRTADRLHVLSLRLRDGQGPVSDSMRVLFGHRSGDAEGLARVLRSYRRALMRVRDEISQAEHGYRTAEENALRLVRP